MATLSWLLSGFQRENQFNMRLGVFLPNWVGDVVMATPALRTLRKMVGPSGRLIGILRPYVAEVLVGTTWLDEYVFCERPNTLRGRLSRSPSQAVRAAKLDRIVLLTNSWRTAWLAWRSGARERIGYRRDGRSWMLTKSIIEPKQANGKPVATLDGYLTLAEAAGGTIESTQLELATTAADEHAADEVWKRLRLPVGDHVVVLNSGGAYGAAKQWPAEHFAELARRIARSSELAVLVNCGPSERGIAKEIVARAASPRVVSLAECASLPIGLTKACIRRSRMLVSTDSGPRYFGVAFGKPVVTLFGPTDPLATKLPYERETSLSLSLECQPCMARTCPLQHHRCMRDLSVDMVYDAIVRSLDASENERAA
jgi:heptosyltransferase-2